MLGNIIRGEGYVLICNSEVIFDLDKVIYIFCVDLFFVIVQLCDFNFYCFWNGNKLVFDGGYLWKSIFIVYFGDEIKCQYWIIYDNVCFMLLCVLIKEFFYEEG